MEHLKNKISEGCLYVCVCLCVYVCFWFSYKSICCGYSFELHWQVNAIQMDTHNICLKKEVDKKYTGCNQKTMEVLDCALIVGDVCGN